MSLARSLAKLRAGTERALGYHGATLTRDDCSAILDRIEELEQALAAAVEWMAFADQRIHGEWGGAVYEEDPAIGIARQAGNAK